MKTAMWVCDRCHVVRFHHHGFQIDKSDPSARQVGTTDDDHYGYVCRLLSIARVSDMTVCNGTVEYYAYADFDRYK